MRFILIPFGGAPENGIKDGGEKNPQHDQDQIPVGNKSSVPGRLNKKEQGDGRGKYNAARQVMHQIIQPAVGSLPPFFPESDELLVLFTQQMARLSIHGTKLHDIGGSSEKTLVFVPESSTASLPVA